MKLAMERGMGCSLPSTLPAPPDSGEYLIPSIRSIHRWVEQCPGCDGHRTTLDQDDDGRDIYVRCEACDGSGEIANCVQCDEIMPAPEGDRRGYRCEHCCKESA